jgi:hypothetical protein
MLLLAAPGWAVGQKKHKAPEVQQAHPFAEVPLAKLSVANTRGERAVVQDKQGAVVLVKAGELLGAEGFRVARVLHGCIVLSGAEAEVTLCVEDRPDVPQT